MISICQAKVLRTDKARAFFGIPKTRPPPLQKLGEQQKGFRAAFKDSMENLKMQRKVVDLRAADRQRFDDAGSAPVQRTFKRNPLQSPNAKKPK